MFNLIKMDLYRLTRMKSFWIMIAVTVSVAFIGAFLADYAMGLESDATAEAGGFFVTINAMKEVPETIPLSDWVISDLSAHVLLLLCAIFAPMFVNGEQKNGYVKNIASQLPNRGMLVFSKLAAVAVQVAVIFAAYFVAFAISGRIFFGDMLVFGSFSQFAKALGIQYLLHFAFSALLAALTICWRGSGLSMCLGILCTTNAIGLVYNLTDILLHKCGVSEHFTIGDYAIENCIAIVTSDLLSGDLPRVLAVGIGFILVSAVGAMFVMRKRDIR